MERGGGGGLAGLDMGGIYLAAGAPSNRAAVGLDPQPGLRTLYCATAGAQLSRRWREVAMKLFFARERAAGETRAALTPIVAAKLAKLGAELSVETGLGEGIGEPDAAYQQAGAQVTSDPAAAARAAGLVFRIRKPEPADVSALAPGTVHVSLLDPFRELELVQALAAAGVSALSLEMIPRTTIAQKMDVLSSQANLAGYVAVILAAERAPRILPMMMTPAGTLSPARVFIIGVGVAGLQAIATAKRLGALVEAFDTRPAVEEQVKSLGARFLKVDLGETGQTKDGYAQALTEEQLARQRAAMAKACAGADIVITAAQVFGRRAPVVVTDEMIRGMRPGSVIVDLAVETGGNVEGITPGTEQERHGVQVVAHPALQTRVPRPASQMFASNLGSLVEHFWDKERGAFALRLEDEIIRGCLVTHGGAVVHPAIRKVLGLAG